MAKNHYYVVWSEEGAKVCASWDECKRLIAGTSGVHYKGFPTFEAAQTAAAGSWEEYYSPAVEEKVRQMNLDLLPAAARPEFPALAVDAACSGNPGVMEYRGVDAQSGQEVFRRGPFRQGTNNIGEFLAIVHGLALLKQKGLDMVLYSDSQTALSWIKQCRCKTKLEENEQNRLLFDIIRRAEQWLRENHYTTRLLKWHTEEWGEIPADFGRK